MIFIIFIVFGIIKHFCPSSAGHTACYVSFFYRYIYGNKIARAIEYNLDKYKCPMQNKLLW